MTEGLSVKARIETKLMAALAPASLRVIDESHLHAGHAGAKPEGETHFRVEIVSDHFAGLSRVAGHRLVNAILAQELAGPVHALAMKVSAPEGSRRAGEDL